MLEEIAQSAGLWKTGQMSGRRALVVTVSLALLAALAQCCLDLGVLTEYRLELTPDK